MRRPLILGLAAFAVVAALATAAVCWWRPGGTAAVAEETTVQPETGVPSVLDGRSAVSNATGMAAAKETGRKRALVPVSEPPPPLSPEDQKITDELSAVRDSMKVKQMSRVVAKAVTSSNPDVRRDAVDTVRLFGREGMAEATLFMCDEDDDVRNEAFDVWRSALFEFEDDDEKSKHILMVMEAVTDRQQLDFMTQQIGELSDYHKANTLVSLITGRNEAVKEIARREYKDLTGSDFTDVETAQKWLDAQEEPEAETESEKKEEQNED